MKEKDLIKLGFKRTDVPLKVSGSKDYYFYTYDFSDASGTPSLLTCADDEVVNGKWTVCLFGYDRLVFSKKSEVKKFIDLVKRNLIEE